VDPVQDPLLFFWQCRESNPGLRICSQELWPLDHRGSPRSPLTTLNSLTEGKGMMPDIDALIQQLHDPRVFLSIKRCHVSIQNTNRFRDWVLSLSSGGTSVGGQSIELVPVSGPIVRRYGQNPLSETFYNKHDTMDIVQTHGNCC
jgi:hypothetical protein